jgi:hypothetical protein
MKNFFKSLGVISMALVIGFSMTGCASLFVSKWDNPLPKEQTATLYFDDQITVWGIDGVTKSAGPVSKGYKGKGSVKNPKPSLKILAGERTINAQFVSWAAEDITYNFVAGRNYQIKAETDKSLIDTSNVGAAFGKSFAAGATGGNMADSGHKFVVTDITKK